MKPQTIQQFFKQYPSDDACLEHLMKVRYGLEGFCPKCGAETKFSRVRSQRAYACQWCGWHTYPCVGTPFENSRTSLQLWFYAIYLFTSTRSGKRRVTVNEVHVLADFMAHAPCAFVRDT